MTVKLTQDQSDACDKFLKFLLSSEKEFHLFGSAGCGKTFLIQHFLSDVLDKYYQASQLFGLKTVPYTVAYTATTNKAVEVLSNSIPNILRASLKTIYSLFDVQVWNDYSSGETKLKCRTPHIQIKNTLIFIDECSMLNQYMLKVIRDHTQNCKIVYIGDNNQLAPINEKAHWNNTDPNYTAYLNIPVRNKNQKALVDLCEQLKETVKTKKFKPIYLEPGVIDLLDQKQAQDWLNADFNSSTDKILTYTNDLSVQYIEYIANRLKSNSNKVGNYYLNSTYVCNDSCMTVQGRLKFYPEQEITLTTVNKSKVVNFDDASLKCHKAVVKDKDHNYYDIYLPEDYLTYKNLLKSVKNKKKWRTYFTLDESVMDLRLPYASTIHKSQGSTYENVYIDLNSFDSCKSLDTAARLLYVACSRAKKRILFYGELPKQYGEILCRT